MNSQGFQISPLGAMLLGAFLSSLFAAITAFIASTHAANKNAAKLEGAVTATLQAHTDKFKEIAIEQDQQWSKINSTQKEVANITGKLEGYKLAKGHHA